MVVDGQPTLTFAGLARVAHHVIETFVARAPKTDTEEFEWMKDLPGTLTMQMAPQHWISNSQRFDRTTAQQYLAAFIGQIIGRLMQPSATITDIRPVLTKIETLVPGLAKPAQRLPMVALHFTFNFIASEDLRTPDYLKFFATYKGDLDTPSIISLAVHLVTDHTPDWSLPVMEELYALHFRERHHANTFKLGQILEAAFTLTLAEQNRAAGHHTRARELIADAVEICPNHASLRSFGASVQVENLSAIDWQAILLSAEASRG